MCAENAEQQAEDKGNSLVLELSMTIGIGIYVAAVNVCGGVCGGGS